MIYFIAPYTSDFLGASTKIEGILKILTQIDEVILINTYDAKSSSIYISKKLGIRVYNLPIYIKDRAVNTAINYLFNNKVVKQLKNNYNPPTTIWLYNSYFFESYLAKTLIATYNSFFIFEIEDSVFSRFRGLHLKPFFDKLAWNNNIKKFDLAFVVNNNISKELAYLKKNIVLLPGLISDDLIKYASKRNPFTDERKITIGYFGGLYLEKGAAFLMELFKNLPVNFHCIVTGTGELDNQFIEFANEYSDRVKFHGRIESQQIYKLMSYCDIILNPHKPISEMNNGVFPFKVFEAIASRRLVFSTQLPTDKMEELLHGVHFLDLNIQKWVNALINSKNIYLANKININNAANKVCENFSELFLKKLIAKYLKADKVMKI